MTAINRTIPTKEDVSSMSKKKITDSLGNRLISIGRSKTWLKEKMIERGMNPRITSNSPDRIVEMFQIIENEREKIEKERAT